MKMGWVFRNLGVVSKFSRAFVLIGPATDDGSREALNSPRITLWITSGYT